MSSKSFRLLDLPPEIREKIYFLVCAHPFEYVPLDVPYAQISYPHSLLSINHQIYQEIRPLYFTQNAFSLTIRRRNDTLFHFLSPTFQDNRRQIRSLKIIFLRWGSKNFFLETLVPILDDCILNGRLKVLHIVVRGKFVRSLEEMGENWKDGGPAAGEEYDNWKGLKKLLGDPYLEKVSLWAGVTGESEVEKCFKNEVTGDVGWLLEDESRR